jgi:SAM-dependent methyltransferase
MAATTGHHSSSPGPAPSLAATRMMSLMSQLVADVPPVVPGVAPVVPGVPSVVPGVPPMMPGVPAVLSGVPSVVPGVSPVVPGAPAAVPGVPLSWEALLPQSDALRQVLDTVTHRNRAVYDALANEYDEKAPRHFTTTHERVDRVAEHIAPGAEILDVGCGVGLALSILSEKFRATGVDVSPRMVELARERSPHTPVVLGDFLTAELPATYDAIWEQAVLHLFPSVTEGVIFERFRALLKPNGILSLSTTVSETRKEDWEPKRDYGPAPVRYRRSITEAELATAFIRHGFGFVNSWVTTDPFGKDWRTVVGRKQSIKSRRAESVRQSA